MRKEFIAAIVIGFALGLIITFGIWSANKAITSQKEQQSTGESQDGIATVAPSGRITPTPSFFLTIIKPENEGISNTSNITLAGSTVPSAQIAVFWEKGEVLIDADESGNFSTQVDLILGINEITVTAFSDNGDEATKKVSIVYSTEKI